MLASFSSHMSSHLTLPPTVPSGVELVSGTPPAQENILVSADPTLLTQVPQSTFGTLGLAQGVSMMDVEPRMENPTLLALDPSHTTLLPPQPPIPPIIPYDPQTWLAQMFTSIVDAGTEARAAIVRGDTSEAARRSREMTETLRLVTDYMNQNSPSGADEMPNPFSPDHPVIAPPPAPLDQAAMTLPSLNDHRKRSSSIVDFAPAPKAAVRKLSHAIIPKTEPETILIPELPPLEPALTPPYAPGALVSSTTISQAASRPPSRFGMYPPAPVAQFASGYELASQMVSMQPMPVDNPINICSTGVISEPSVSPHLLSLSTSAPLDMAAPTFPPPIAPSVAPMSTMGGAGAAFPPDVPQMNRGSRAGSISSLFDRQSAFMAPVAPINPQPSATTMNMLLDMPFASASPPDDSETTGDDDEQGDSSMVSKHGLDIPTDQLQDIDQIFIAFLRSLCSNLDATDKNGEPIHQALMPKKMEKFAQSKDFRPFKFRIQAFTHAFVDELANHGYTDDKIQCKKIRQYLWRQPYIMRFNEEGKKAKSKGNHIWVVEARKTGEGGWEFRKFTRKFANCHSSVCYVGLPWSWTPHIWDPQASLKDVPVRYESHSLPPWLSWSITESGTYVLSGTPPLDADNVEIRTDAHFVVDGKEERISMSFPLHVAPSSTGSRRPSLSDTPTRRSVSDPALSHRSSNPSLSLSSPPRTDPQFVATVTEVLKVAAQRVQQERVSHNAPLETLQFDALCKQQQVLNRAVNAYTEEQRNPGYLQTSGEGDAQAALAKTAEQVVVQAVHTVIADKAAGVGVPVAVAPKNASIVEVSAVTQEALAKALARTTLHAHEVHVMQTTSKVLKEQEQALSPTSMSFEKTSVVDPATVIRVRSVPASLATVPEYP